jgi:hypothetical protein
MPNPISGIDNAGGVVRRLIGELADDRDVYYPFSKIATPDEEYLGKDALARNRDFMPPPPGSESGMLDPHQLILRKTYNDDLAEEALMRLPLGGMQTPIGSGHIPILARPSGPVSVDGDSGRHVALYLRSTGQRQKQALDVTEDYSDPIRLLIHEARHSTELPGRDLRRALSSLASQRPEADGLRLKDQSRRYYSQPSEAFAYLTEAGDDFVRERGRLVRNARDANAVMERVEAGESLQRLHPLARMLYSEGYKNSPTARRHINEILTRYFAVPAAAATQSGEE